MLMRLHPNVDENDSISVGQHSRVVAMKDPKQLHRGDGGGSTDLHMKKKGEGGKHAKGALHFFARCLGR